MFWNRLQCLWDQRGLIVYCHLVEGRTGHALCRLKLPYPHALLPFIFHSFYYIFLFFSYIHDFCPVTGIVLHLVVRLRTMGSRELPIYIFIFLLLLFTYKKIIMARPPSPHILSYTQEIKEGLPVWLHLITHPCLLQPRYHHQAKSPLIRNLPRTSLHFQNNKKRGKVVNATNLRSFITQYNLQEKKIFLRQKSKENPFMFMINHHSHFQNWRKVIPCCYVLVLKRGKKKFRWK